jgi:hypothetical protein
LAQLQHSLGCGSTTAGRLFKTCPLEERPRLLVGQGDVSNNPAVQLLLLLLP